MQFAHYLGYFLMAMPAGWLATKLGYKGGIIAGLLIVAVGGFWFIPATHIARSSGRFLLGVCIIAAGLTFLETIANPYTTVLGPLAIRRDPHQSRAILQRHRPALAGRSGRHLLLFEERGRARAPAAERCGSLTPAIGGRLVIVLAVVFYFASARYQDGGRLPSGRRDAATSRIRSGRIRIS